MSRRGLVAWSAGAILVLAAVVYLAFGREPQPNYSLSATFDCLHYAGYAVSHGRRVDGFPGLVVSRKGYYDVDVYFMPSEAAARRFVAKDSSDSGGADPRERNAVFINAGGGFPDFLDACMRTR